MAGSDADLGVLVPRQLGPEQQAVLRSGVGAERAWRRWGTATNTNPDYTEETETGTQNEDWIEQDAKTAIELAFGPIPEIAIDPKKQLVAEGSSFVSASMAVVSYLMRFFRKYEDLQNVSPIPDRSKLKYLLPYLAPSLDAAPAANNMFCGEQAVDLSPADPCAFTNAEYLRALVARDPRLRPLVILIKHWARMHGNNSAYDGTLNSFGYAMLVAHFLAVESSFGLSASTAANASSKTATHNNAKAASYDNDKAEVKAANKPVMNDDDDDNDSKRSQKATAKTPINTASNSAGNAIDASNIIDVSSSLASLVTPLKPVRVTRSVSQAVLSLSQISLSQSQTATTPAGRKNNDDADVTLPLPLPQLPTASASVSSVLSHNSNSSSAGNGSVLPLLVPGSVTRSRSRSIIIAANNNSSNSNNNNDVNATTGGEQTYMITPLKRQRESANASVNDNSITDMDNTTQDASILAGGVSASGVRRSARLSLCIPTASQSVPHLVNKNSAGNSSSLPSFAPPRPSPSSSFNSHHTPAGANTRGAAQQRFSVNNSSIRKAANTRGSNDDLDSDGDDDGGVNGRNRGKNSSDDDDDDEDDEDYYADSDGEDGGLVLSNGLKSANKGKNKDGIHASKNSSDDSSIGNSLHGQRSMMTPLLDRLNIKSPKPQPLASDTPMTADADAASVAAAAAAAAAEIAGVQCINDSENEAKAQTQPATADSVATASAEASSVPVQIPSPHDLAEMLFPMETLLLRFFRYFHSDTYFAPSVHAIRPPPLASLAGTHVPGTSNLKSASTAALPGYLVPRSSVSVDVHPRTPNPPLIIVNASSNDLNVAKSVRVEGWAKMRADMQRSFLVLQDVHNNVVRDLREAYELAPQQPLQAAMTMSDIDSVHDREMGSVLAVTDGDRNTTGNVPKGSRCNVSVTVTTAPGTGSNTPCNSNSSTHGASGFASAAHSDSGDNVAREAKQPPLTPNTTALQSLSSLSPRSAAFTPKVTTLVARSDTLNNPASEAACTPCTSPSSAASIAASTVGGANVDGQLNFVSQVLMERLALRWQFGIDYVLMPPPYHENAEYWGVIQAHCTAKDAEMMAQQMQNSLQQK